MEITLVVILLFVFLLLGMPVAFALGITGMLGIYLVAGFDALIGQSITTPYRSVASVTLSTIPLFILMAELMNVGGIGSQMFEAAKRLVGRIPGGIAIATVFASAGFGAVSGSSTAASGTIGSISMPEFKKLGYHLPSAAGIIAMAGTLAILIPPSIALIIYGVTTETSIGQLFIAGIIPGILTTFMYTLAIYIWSKRRPQSFPRGEKYTTSEILQSIKPLWGVIFIILLILFSLYGGVTTATEIAAVGVGLTFIYLVIMKRMDFEKVKIALTNTLRTSVMIFSIVIGAMLFAYFLTLSQVTQNIIILLGELNIAPIFIMLIIALIYIILGFFMDQISILLITLPITFPLINSLGFDAVWFGIIVVKLVEVGLVTPPVGMNVFVTSGATGVPVEKIFKGVGFLLIFEIITLIILLFIPSIITWLPSLMVK